MTSFKTGDAIKIFPPLGDGSTWHPITAATYLQANGSSTDTPTEQELFVFGEGENQFMFSRFNARFGAGPVFSPGQGVVIVAPYGDGISQFIVVSVQYYNPDGSFSETLTDRVLYGLSNGLALPAQYLAGF